MSKLKESLINKMDIEPGKKFDSDFFAKLEKEKQSQPFMAKWYTWLLSGCVTASVLFFAINTYYVPEHHSFDHQEYVDNVLEVQTYSDESALDLTGEIVDEI